LESLSRECGPMLCSVDAEDNGACHTLKLTVKLTMILNQYECS
jgi:hypothetical protein